MRKQGGNRGIGGGGLRNYEEVHDVFLFVLLKFTTSGPSWSKRQ